MKVLFAIGTRPEAIKLCPVVAAAKRSGELSPIVLSTGQHRDMLGPVFDAFGIETDFDLDVMEPNQTLPGVFAKILERSAPILEDVKPDWIVVQGDTTTVAALGIAGFYSKIPVAHVEAGLRTDNRHEPFPEEINRRLASVTAERHFAPTRGSRENLLREGHPTNSIVVSGNTVIDALKWSADLAPTSSFCELEKTLGNGSAAKNILLTAHRRENHGAPLESICRAVEKLCRRFGDAVRFFYPVHPNPNVLGPVTAALGEIEQVSLLPPLDYVTLVQLMNRVDLVVTDSGGIQEEAPSLGKPVLVLRDVTERPEGVDAGTARLVGTDDEVIVGAVSELLTDPAVYENMANAVNPYGDGHASERIVASLLERPFEEWQPSEVIGAQQ